MIGPKELHMEMVDEACAEFEDQHRRPPTREEEDEIADRCYAGLHDRYIDMANFAKDKTEE